MGKPPTPQQCGENGCEYPVNPKSAERYRYPYTLRKFTPDMQPDLAEDELRITFLGTGYPPPRINQSMTNLIEAGPDTYCENGC